MPRAPGRFRIAGPAALLAAALAAACTPIGPPAAGRDRPAVAAPDDADLFAYDPEARPLRIGEAVPELELIDREGYPLPLSALRGEVVVLTFFTAAEARRPAGGGAEGAVGRSEILDRFGALPAALSPELANEVRLIAVLLDASPDAAGVPEAVAGSVPWTLARAAPHSASRTATAFGVALWQSAGGEARQTYNTVVIDRRGRLADQFPGLDAWSVMDLVAAISAAAGRD